jgi:hypothetical protein
VVAVSVPGLEIVPVCRIQLCSPAFSRPSPMGRLRPRRLQRLASHARMAFVVAPHPKGTADAGPYRAAITPTMACGELVTSTGLGALVPLVPSSSALSPSHPLTLIGLNRGELPAPSPSPSILSARSRSLQRRPKLGTPLTPPRSSGRTSRVLAAHTNPTRPPRRRSERGNRLLVREDRRRGR